MTATPDLQSLTADLLSLGPLVTVPWHPQQRAALASATDVVMIGGGSRSGKSTTLMGMVSRLIRREGPVYRRLKAAHTKNPDIIPDPDTRPLKVWIAPKTGEKAQSVWEPLLREQAFAGMTFSYVQSPHRVFTWADGVSKDNTLWLKSQDQGLLAFESDDVDFVGFDEEPLDRKIVGAATTRTATTGGIVVLAFTPLHGLTWTHGAYFVPAVKDEHRKADRVWRVKNRLTVIQMGMADNPAAVAGGGVQRLRDDPTISEAERQTRLYGTYGYAEGLIFPVLAGLFTDQPDSIYLLDELPRNRAYSWVLTCDPNKRHGGLLVALDEEGNRYCVAEHYAENLPDREHVARYRAMLTAMQVPEETTAIFADPGGAGAQSILNLADLGFYAEAVPKGPGSVKASIEMVRRALWPNPAHAHPVTGKLGSPSLYFLRSLCSTWNTEGVEYDESRLLWELRQYRQKEDAPPDTPVKANDDCIVGDTEILTSHGIERVEDMVGTSGWLVAPTGLCAYRDVRATHDGIPQPIVRVTTEDGRWFECTPSHLLLTPEGWRPAAQCGLSEILDISETVHYRSVHESHHRRAEQAAISGTYLHPDQGRVLPLYEPNVAPRGMEGGEWADSSRPRRASSGSQPREQHIGESRAYPQRFASASAHDTREAGGVWGATQSAPSGDSADGVGMASLPRRESVASGARHPVVSQGQASVDGWPAPNMRQSEVPQRISTEGLSADHLFREMQGGGAEAIGSGQRDANLRRVRSHLHNQSVLSRQAVLAEVWGARWCRIASIETRPAQVVYNLEVEEDACYTVSRGLVVHNCADPLLYSFLVRPYVPGEDAPKWGAPPTPPKHLDRMSAIAAEEYDKALKRVERENRRRR